MTFSAIIVFILIAIFIREIFFKPSKKPNHTYKNQELYLKQLNSEIKKKEQQLNELLIMTDHEKEVKGSWKRNNWKNF